MRSPYRFVAFTLAILLASLVGCASTTKHQGAGDYVDDSVNTTKVEAAIFNEPTLKSAEIDVEAFKGNVQLSGFVSSSGDIIKAGELARGVKGVTSIQNDTRVRGPDTRQTADGSVSSSRSKAQARYLQIKSGRVQ